MEGSEEVPIVILNANIIMITKTIQMTNNTNDNNNNKKKKNDENNIINNHNNKIPSNK